MTRRYNPYLDGQEDDDGRGVIAWVVMACVGVAGFLILWAFTPLSVFPW